MDDRDHVDDHHDRDFEIDFYHDDHRHHHVDHPNISHLHYMKIIMVLTLSDLDTLTAFPMISAPSSSSKAFIRNKNGNIYYES